MLTQAQMARELHLSRSTVNDNVQAGMPLTCPASARDWRRRNIAEKWTSYRSRQHGVFAPPAIAPSEPDEDAELTRIESEREELLRVAWGRFKSSPALTEDAKGYSEATLLGCWAISGLIANGVDEKEAFEYASFAMIVTSATGDLAYKPN